MVKVDLYKIRKTKKFHWYKLG